jgi:type IVB pilus formation R64 PilN family outer membrane protein
MKTTSALLACLSIAITMLSGCSNIQSIKDTTTQSSAMSRDSDSYIRDAQKNTGSNDDNVTVHNDGFYVPLIPIARQKLEPAALKCPFGYNPHDAVRLDMVAKRITDTCHLAVRISADAQQVLSSGRGQRGGSNGNSGGSQPGSVPPPPVAALTGGNGQFPLGSAQGGVSAQNNTVSISYSGELHGFLDAVTGQLGLSWRYDDEGKVVTIFYVESKTYSIDAIASDTSVVSSVMAGANSAAGASGGGGGSGGGSSGGISGASTSTSTSDVTTKSSTSSDIKASVDALLTPGVGTASPISASTGTITVTDTPEVLDRISAMLDQFNARLTKQMRFNVMILSFTGTNEADAGVNWTALYTNLLRNYSIGLASNYTAQSTSSTATINILQSSTHFSGSQAIINALNAQGHATIKTETPVSTLNLQSASVQVAENQFYLASSSVTGGTTTGSASQSALQPGSFTVGYNLSLLPYALQDGKNILLQFNVNISSLKQLRKITSDGSSLEAPDINLRLIQQKVRLKVGQTLILSGFQQNSLSVNRQGTGLPGVFNYVFGGGANTNNTKETLVVLITPTTLD